MLLRSRECRPLLGGGFLLVFRPPFVIGHAIDDLARFGIGERDATVFGFRTIPFREAVAAKAGEVHQIDVLNVGPLAEMLHEAAERRGLEFDAGLVVHRNLLVVAQLYLASRPARLKRYPRWAAARRRISSIVKSSLCVAMNQR